MWQTRGDNTLIAESALSATSAREYAGFAVEVKTTDRCAQGVINQDIDRLDVFVLTLHRRWGEEAPDAPLENRRKR